MPIRKGENIKPRRQTDDFKDAAAALANRGDDPMAMRDEGAGSAMFPSLGGFTEGAGLSDDLVQRLAHMVQTGSMTIDELRDVLMARASLPEIVAGNSAKELTTARTP